MDIKRSKLDRYWNQPNQWTAYLRSAEELQRMMQNTQPATRKIRDLDGEPGWPGGTPCKNPNHNPPMHQVFSPGVYEHICPGCGARKEFTVRRPVWNADGGRRDAPPALPDPPVEC